MEIIKPGKIGTGILIEYDAGHISPKNTFNKKIIKEMEDRSIQQGPIIFHAILQKSGVENRNGRVYPDKILKREGVLSLNPRQFRSWLKFETAN